MRKIKEKLLDRLIKGDLKPLLNYIKSDKSLSLEVRRGDAFVYYRKGKALEIGSKKVDKKYGNVPNTNLVINDPATYFKLIKKSIDNWLDKNKKRAEFDTQQNIMKYNQEFDDKYLILDMEYAFEQNEIEKENREKRGIFDLLGIERETSKIIFFEVKKGMGATKGKSGIEEHINDFELHLFGKNKELFRGNLTRDIRNILQDKIKLGILKKITIPTNLDQYDPELVFIFHPDKVSEIKEFEIELENRKELIIVTERDYKLR